MSVIVKARGVRDPVHGIVGVEHTNDGSVKVTWFCGEARTFHPEALRNIVKHLRVLGDRPNVSMDVYDQLGAKVTLMLREGRLFANGRWASVEFEHLRKAIKATLKDVKDHAGSGI